MSYNNGGNTGKFNEEEFKNFKIQLPIHIATLSGILNGDSQYRDMKYSNVTELLNNTLALITNNSVFLSKGTQDALETTRTIIKITEIKQKIDPKYLTGMIDQIADKGKNAEHDVDKKVCQLLTIIAAIPSSQGKKEKNLYGKMQDYVKSKTTKKKNNNEVQRSRHPVLKPPTDEQFINDYGPIKPPPPPGLFDDPHPQHMHAASAPAKLETGPFTKGNRVQTKDSFPDRSRVQTKDSLPDRSLVSSRNSNESRNTASSVSTKSTRSNERLSEKPLNTPTNEAKKPSRFQGIKNMLYGNRSKTSTTPPATSKKAEKPHSGTTEAREQRAFERGLNETERFLNKGLRNENVQDRKEQRDLVREQRINQTKAEEEARKRFAYRELTPREKAANMMAKPFNAAGDAAGYAKERIKDVNAGMLSHEERVQAAFDKMQAMRDKRREIGDQIGGYVDKKAVQAAQKMQDVKEKAQEALDDMAKKRKYAREQIAYNLATGAMKAEHRRQQIGGALKGLVVNAYNKAPSIEQLKAQMNYSSKVLGSWIPSWHEEMSARLKGYDIHISGEDNSVRFMKATSPDKLYGDVNVEMLVKLTPNIKPTGSFKMEFLDGGTKESFDLIATIIKDGRLKTVPFNLLEIPEDMKDFLQQSRDGLEQNLQGKADLFVESMVEHFAKGNKFDCAAKFVIIDESKPYLLRALANYAADHREENKPLTDSLLKYFGLKIAEQQIEYAGERGYTGKLKDYGMLTQVKSSSPSAYAFQAKDLEEFQSTNAKEFRKSFDLPPPKPPKPHNLGGGGRPPSLPKF